MKRILLTGGPGTGKTTVLQHLKDRGHTCFEEVSRAIILEAQENGIEQLYLTHPEAFNNKLLKGRIQQHLDCETINTDFIFLDRGIPDIIAYNNYINVANSNSAIKATQQYLYDFVFVFPPWKDIYKKDNERYETYEEAVKIYEDLKKTYLNLGYEVLEIPIDTVNERTNYILNIVEYS